MRRNGWRALQRDGVWLDAPRIEARMVVVPDANSAYFVIVDGRGGASFWRTLDEALFDRLLPRAASSGGMPQTPAPNSAQAGAVAGVYEASEEASPAPLKSKGQRLIVRASDDGSLMLSGGENAVLSPRPGGYWAAESGNLNAVASDGRLILSTGPYRPLRWWKRPASYAALALLSSVGAAGAFAGTRRGQSAGAKLRLAEACLRARRRSRGLPRGRSVRLAPIAGTVTWRQEMAITTMSNVSPR